MVNRKGSPGTIAVLFSSEAARYSSFTADLDGLSLPIGSVKDFEFGPDPSESRNQLVARAIEAGQYWIWFISEDFTFQPDIVEVMLSRDQAIVAPIVLETSAPFHAQAYTDRAADGSYTNLRLNEVTGPGTMVEVRAASTYGMLVRRAVFEAIDPPWFRKEETNDSITFCERARASGFQAYVDTSVRLGNRCTASIYPTHKGGKWELSIGVGDEIEMSVPLKH